MGGGLIQIVSIGEENLFLSESPQITYFKKVYKRHTNFSIESIPQNFSTDPNFGSKVTCTLSKTNGDLINKMYISLTLPALPKLPFPGVCKWVKHIGFAIIKTVELEIGGKLIDKHYGDWLYIWHELNKDNNNRGLDKMIGNVPELTEFSNGKDSYKLYIPLIFFFCKDYNLSLPLVAIESAEVKIHIEFSDISNCLILAPSHYITVSNPVMNLKQYEMLYINSKNSNNNVQYINYDYYSDYNNYIYYLKTNPNNAIVSGNTLNSLITNYQYTTNSNEVLYYNSDTVYNTILNSTIVNGFLYVDYIFLDTPERFQFARSNHEYVIDVLQYDSEKLASNTNFKIKLGYTYPVKEIFVRATQDYLTTDSGYWLDVFNYTTSWNILTSTPLIKKMQIYFNSVARESNYPSYFYTQIQSFQHHKHIASKGLFLYSFAINPTNSQPSGTCNFSKLDDISLFLTMDPIISYTNNAKVRIYALNYNVFKIFNGIPSLVFDY